VMRAEAVAELGNYVVAEWGTGYYFHNVSEGPVIGSAVAHVSFPGDGSWFWVGVLWHGATRVRGDTYQEVERQLLEARVREVSG
jgi:hypothetical protein